jgi:hypothetical protein
VASSSDCSAAAPNFPDDRRSVDDLEGLPAPVKALIAGPEAPTEGRTGDHVKACLEVKELELALERRRLLLGRGDLAPFTPAAPATGRKRLSLVSAPGASAAKQSENTQDCK